MIDLQVERYVGYKKPCIRFRFMTAELFALLKNNKRTFLLQKPLAYSYLKILQRHNQTAPSVYNGVFT